MSLSEQLRRLNITLPPVSGPYGAYIPAKRVGNLIYIAGQVPMRDGQVTATGKVPSQCSIDDALKAARLCAINCVAAVQSIPGGIDQLVGVARVGVYVNSDSTFTDQPRIGNAASELFVELFGEAGRHARSAIGVNTLPRDAAVEVDVIFEAKP
jgi:enamine deaminase RidA (YjgF/YER057c/UK114 family)